ncbi:hypothetical protein NUW58_g9318 [Xylaria curta]|uniref:Uncharacterized protein n=1 Tax=Xylaria curta TaxID=42375 RepID=A0ACC1MY61_9PEZI|nr:hypothetical protein NUW58_g9318 [Xylaria curta]
MPPTSQQQMMPQQQFQQQQQMQQQQQQQNDGGKSDTLKLRLDLNLEVEVTLKARIHGDLTLALLLPPSPVASLLNLGVLDNHESRVAEVSKQLLSPSL